MTSYSYSSSPPSTSSGSVLSSSRAHNEPHGAGHSSSSGKKARGRSLSPFKKQREPKRDEVSNISSGSSSEHERPRMMTLEGPASLESLQQRFDSMLASRDIPAEMRATLSNLKPAVKESLIRNQASVSLSSLGALGHSNRPHQQASSPDKTGRPNRTSSTDEFPQSDLLEHRASRASPSKAGSRIPRDEMFGSKDGGGRGRGRSVSPSKILVAPRNPSPSRPASSSSSSTSPPVYYARMLLETSSQKLDIEKLRRLRVLLSTESPSWLADFLFTKRGYEGLMRRIGELIEMEWRDEIHDDKALHELLRGLVALGATDRGKLALTSAIFRPYQPQLASQPARSAHLPSTSLVGAPAKEVNPPELPVGWERHPPFGPLTALLLSERKPGDLNTRKLIVELLKMTLSLTLPSGLDRDVFDALKADRELSSCYQLYCQEQAVSPLQLLLLLLHNPISSRSLSLLPFISKSHHPRPFKTYLMEIACVVRDYFWIFCHGQNRFYDWRAMGEEGRQKIDGPSVPGGMTGGVEFEAIGYITTHLKLINCVADLLSLSSSEDSRAPLLFHVALFDSGMERLLLTLRRASQQYYGPMHLALAHYIHLARQSGYRLSGDLQSWCERRLQLRNAVETDDGRLGLDFRNIESQKLEENRHARPISPTKASLRLSDKPASPAKQRQEQASRSASPTKARAALSSPPSSSTASVFPSSSPPKLASRLPDDRTQQTPGAAPTRSSAKPSVTIPSPNKPTANTFHAPVSPSRTSYGQDSLSGHWLGQNATALLVASSISSESFFDEAWPTEEDAVACSVPLPESPVKADRGAERAFDWSRAPREEVREAAISPESSPAQVSPPRSQPSAPLGNAASQFGGPSRSLGGPNHTSVGQGKSQPPPVVVGTARDRIRLWEGRAANASTGSGAGLSR